MTCKEEFGCCISAGQVCDFISCSSHGPFLGLILLKGLYYRFNAVPIEMPTTIFTELEQIILKLMWKAQKTPDSKKHSRELKKKPHKPKGVILSDFS